MSDRADIRARKAIFQALETITEEDWRRIESAIFDADLKAKIEAVLEEMRPVETAKVFMATSTLPNGSILTTAYQYSEESGIGAEIFRETLTIEDQPRAKVREAIGTDGWKIIEFNRGIFKLERKL